MSVVGDASPCSDIVRLQFQLTSGAGAFGYGTGSASSGSGTFTADNVDITTTGDSAKTVRVVQGMATATNSIITSGGNAAGGLDADGLGYILPSTIEATNDTILSTGNSSRGGLQPENFGRIDMNGGTVTTTGAGSPAIWMNNGATLNATDVIVKRPARSSTPLILTRAAQRGLCAMRAAPWR
jgi:hypothetical protein